MFPEETGCFLPAEAVCILITLCKEAVSQVLQVGSAAMRSVERIPAEIGKSSVYHLKNKNQLLSTALVRQWT